MDSIYHFLKIFNKFFFLNSLNKKDGILFMLNGLILLLVGWRDWFILMLMGRSGFKLMLVHRMRLWRFLNKRVGYLKLNKRKEMVSLILKFKWINKLLKLKENMRLENSSNIYKSTNPLLTSKEAALTSINIYK